MSARAIRVTIAWMPTTRAADGRTETEQLAAEAILFHYTSAEALIQIVKSGVLWASNINYLNDGSEFLHALAVADDVLQQIERRRRGAPLIKALRAVLTPVRRANTFVLSFSGASDLLSQWRAYCPASRGVAIGISLQRLRSVAASQGFALTPCIYDLSDQEAVVESILRELFRKFDAGPKRRDVAFWADEFASRFRIHAPAFKHSSFREEREWRLVSDELAVNDPGIRFRQGSSFVVPYVEFDIPRADGELQFDAFVVGPTPHSELAQQSMRSLLEVHRCRWRYLVPSQVPYRPW
jgi:hypothetical protein